ncbi:DUF397 domain-containing protein [Streptomyces sp. NPDC056105]|uniref:DUF397 domain-containing protein n=1 Tax=Streptomyces sp. NPDC056105 TaxID=3345714 RepID=UPI0035DF505D
MASSAPRLSRRGVVGIYRTTAEGNVTDRAVGRDDCGLAWFKSSFSSSSSSSSSSSGVAWRGVACVEVAGTPTAIHVRDSKGTRRSHFTVTPAAWAVFVAAR